MESKLTDILVIGSGVSGLFFALKTAQKRPDLSITILTKSDAKNSNTRYAQGGIAVVTDLINDSFEKHINDTIKAGGEKGDVEVIRMVVTQAPQRLRELLDFEVEFDRKHSGAWDLGLEGGHSEHRILHHKDISGLEIEEKLLLQIRSFSNIQIIEDHIVLDLLTHDNTCVGVNCFNISSNQVEQFFAKKTLLCTGGCGQVFKYTTNPEIGTGDGVAMAHRVGAAIADMQYIQFHPTALYERDRNPYFLISEAVRGFGAYIVNHNNKRFVFDYDERGELATRDIVSHAIGSELAKSGQTTAFIDCRHLDYQAFYKHFPTITDYCKQAGIDIEHELIPVVPVAHYQCGGISVDMDSKTTVPNLYAVGECARTGLHGNNRLASNSLLEALVYAHQASKDICSSIDATSFVSKTDIVTKQITTERSELLNQQKSYLKEAMTALFIQHKPVEEVIQVLNTIEQTLLSVQTSSLQAVELNNLLTVSLLIANQFEKK
jgi:L-aspartate oxidase